jgi:hypothetical protein
MLGNAQKRMKSGKYLTSDPLLMVLARIGRPRKPENGLEPFSHDNNL